MQLNDEWNNPDYTPSNDNHISRSEIKVLKYEDQLQKILASVDKTLKANDFLDDECKQLEKKALLLERVINQEQKDKLSAMLQIDEYKDTIQSDILKFPQTEEAKNDPQSLIKSIDG